MEEKIWRLWVHITTVNSEKKSLGSCLKIYKCECLNCRVLEVLCKAFDIFLFLFSFIVNASFE